MKRMYRIPPPLGDIFNWNMRRWKFIWWIKMRFNNFYKKFRNPPRGGFLVEIPKNYQSDAFMNLKIKDIKSEEDVNKIMSKSWLSGFIEAESLKGDWNRR